jgi:hypothetical protein
MFLYETFFCVITMILALTGEGKSGRDMPIFSHKKVKIIEVS